MNASGWKNELQEVSCTAKKNTQKEIGSSLSAEPVRLIFVENVCIGQVT